MKRLLLGLVLIFFTSGILLLSDLQHRHSRSKSIHDIAVLQFNSRRVMDETVEGMIQGLKEKGFIHDNNISLAFFNAEGDLPTATAIAKEITSDKYKMVLTASTPCMQAVANANQNGNTIHVFCAVTDPFSAGVGLRREAPLDHPPHLVGVGTFQPVVETFELAKKVFPALQSVGVVWNPSEACSEACTKLARQISEKLDIKLVEANIDNSVAVKEAASSLAQKNIQAFYVGGDNTVDIAISVLIDVADKAGIPVFTNDPKNVQEGALFCLGANYRNVGIIAGQMAGDILSGQDPATIPIENRVPQKLYINKKSLSHLEQDWEFPPDILERADGVVDEQGSFTEKNQTIPISPVEQKTAGEASSRQKLPSDGKNEPFSVHVIKFLESPACEQSETGLYMGLKESGLIEGEDYVLKIRSAQGDIATLRMLVDAALTEEAQMLITFSTPTLQTAIKRATEIPIVFTHVADPIVAGAGKSNTDHLPNVTGAYNLSDYAGLISYVRQCLPQAKTVGTLFSPSELNSVFHKNNLTKAGDSLGIKVITVGANSSVEVYDAAMSLCNRGIDAICQIADNLCDGSFPSIAQAAQKNAMPLSGFASHNLKSGAFLVLARDFEDTGKEAGRIAARVIRGENPANIPFSTIRSSRLAIHLPVAAGLGIQIPQNIKNQAVDIIR